MNGIPLPVKVEKKDYYIPYKAVNCMCISREGGRGMNHHHHHHPPPGKFMQTKKNYFVKLHSTHPATNPFTPSPLPTNKIN